MLDKMRRWMVLGLCKLALRVHHKTFIMFCKITVLHLLTKQHGADGLEIGEDDDGNLTFRPVYNDPNETRH